MRHFELFFLGRIQQLMALPQARQDNHHHRCRLMLPFFGTPLSGAFWSPKQLNELLTLAFFEHRWCCGSTMDLGAANVPLAQTVWSSTEEFTPSESFALCILPPCTQIGADANQWRGVLNMHKSCVETRLQQPLGPMTSLKWLMEGPIIGDNQPESSVWRL
jgi:hypothetical protein